MQLLINFLLLVFSVVLFFILRVAGIFYRLFFVRKNLADYFYGGASTLSHGANYFGADLWNVILITPGAVSHFGNQDESMSGVIGKNKRTKTLTKLGRLTAWALNKVEPKHVEKAIEDDE